MAQLLNVGCKAGVSSGCSDVASHNSIHHDVYMQLACALASGLLHFLASVLPVTAPCVHNHTSSYDTHSLACDALAVPQGSRINITSMVVSIVLGTALLVVVVSAAVCLARRWRERRRRIASMQTATFEMGASMFEEPVHSRGASNGVYGAEGLVGGHEGPGNGVHEERGGDCYRSSTPDGVMSWGHERHSKLPKKQ